MIVSMIRGVSVMIAAWSQIGVTRGQRRSCTRFGGLCGLAQIFKSLGCLCTSGRVVHFTFSPFDITSVFTETALVTDTWPHF